MKTDSRLGLRKIGVNLFCWVFYYSGLLWVVRQAIVPFLEPKATILYYHRVREDGGDRRREGVIRRPIEGGVSRQMFEKQMRLLAKSFRVLSLDWLVRRLRNGQKLDYNVVCITFDDGYLDNYQLAFPILRRYGLPATIFIVSGHVGTKDPLWGDRLSSLLKGLIKAKASWRHTDLDGLPEELHTALKKLWEAPMESKGKQIEQVVQLFKQFSPARRQQVVRELEELANGWDSDTEDGEDYRLLSWEQLQEMTANGITVGAHTVSHPLLSQLTRQQAWAEIYESKAQIEHRLGRPVSLFSYPSGDFGTDTKNLARRAGFAAACTTVHGRVDRHVDLLELPRIGVTENTFCNLFGRFSRSVFQVKMCRLFDRVSLR